MSQTLLQAKDYAIAAAGTARISIPGTYFQLMESTSDVTIRFFRNDSEIGIAENVPEGFTFGPIADPWHRVEIQSAAAQTVKVSISRAPTGLLRITGAIDADVTKGATVTAGNGSVGAASALLLAADSTRRCLTLKNTHAAQTLYVTGETPATTNDYPLDPGESHTFSESAKGAFYVIGSGAATTYAYNEEKD